MPVIAQVLLAFNVRAVVYRRDSEAEVLAEARAAFAAGERLSPGHVELIEIRLTDADAMIAEGSKSDG